MTTHVPVLLKEVMEGLNIRPGMFVVDGTLGGGGHTKEILNRIGGGTLLAVDRDPDAVERFRAESDLPAGATALQAGKSSGAVILESANFSALVDILRRRNLGEADGLLLDLGFSSDQTDPPAGGGRGFSFMRDEPLIMTYDPAQKPVMTLLKELDHMELAQIIRSYGDERYAQRIADAIKNAVRRAPIETSRALADIIVAAVPSRYEHGRIHPATRTFQALRIYANDELGALENVLADIEWIVRPGGRVAIISFHSGEDRIVKRAFRVKEKEGVLKIITKKPVRASPEEVRANPRARSAKLRIAEVI
ncbi:MAG: 16S rRNA (cytosine(1402)-N(4))-methyltransferase RsmH [Candidatus Liptonbacteria bacterium]|nr:16S rRNA (cytosine(1402)-N(4))-methyltransferase RsmH [Candidatus Liptonbacteria bacterium]